MRNLFSRLRSCLAGFLFVVSVCGNVEAVAKKAERLNYDDGSSCEIELFAGTGIVRVAGVQNRSVKEGKEFCSFLGIPYAEAPVGPNRFREPRPLGLMHRNYWDFTEIKPECTQFSGTEITGEEDCLYLNVFTRHGVSAKKTSSKKLKPVVVWIHGGSFVIGSAFSNNFHPDPFIDEDIVVVSLNYRLDIFGFFPSYPGENFPNNAGLLDQIAVLKWVQEHISLFNGDPQQVTIMGWSAGAASVNYHMYDEKLQGLFHRAIAMSGAFSNSWAFYYNSFDCRYRFCKAFQIQNCSIPGIQAAKVDFNEYFRQMYEKKLFLMEFGTLRSCFGPTMDLARSDLNPQETMRYFNSVPNDVPLLVGLTNQETKFMEVGRFIEDFPTDFKFPNQDKRIIESIDTFLKDVKNVSEDQLNEMREMYHGIEKFIELHYEKTEKDMFFYRYYYNRNDLNGGAAHGDDLDLLFQSHLVNQSQLIGDEIVSSSLTRMWSSFIKYGNPTKNSPKSEWPPYSNSSKFMLQIGRWLHLSKWQPIKTFKIWDKFYNCLYFLDCSPMYSFMAKWRLTSSL